MGDGHLIILSLFQVVTNKSLFDDKSAEIQELTNHVKKKISQLNRDILRLQELTKRSKSSSTTGDYGEHSHQVVLTLQSKLAQISSSFKDALTSRSQVGILNSCYVHEKCI